MERADLDLLPPALALWLRGAQLPAREAAALEASLSSRPDDLDAHSVLLAYYAAQAIGQGFTTRSGLPHAKWLVEHAPGSVGAGLVHMSGIPEDASGDLDASWNAAVAAHADDARVFFHAAKFFRFDHPARSGELLARARQLDPGLPATLPENEFEPGDFHPASTSARAVPSAPPSADEESFHADVQRLHAAVREARAGDVETLARDVLARAEQGPKQYDYGDALHYGHLALGLCALARGDRSVAARELLLAADTPGSPVLGSFGPNFSLAKALLESGEKTAVLAFIDRCAAFWKLGSGRLDLWRRQIHEGVVPDFSMSML